MENIDVVDVEIGTTIAIGRLLRLEPEAPDGRYWRINASLMLGSRSALIPSPGTNQSFDKYYKRIMDQFNEHKRFGDYAKIHMIQNEGATSHRWSTIKAACNKFHGCLEMVCKLKISEANMNDHVSQISCAFDNMQ
jgi:hypothetical protein